jgi:hypothetical protein
MEGQDGEDVNKKRQEGEDVMQLEDPPLPTPEIPPTNSAAPPPTLTPPTLCHPLLPSLFYYSFYLLVYRSNYVLSCCQINCVIAGFNLCLPYN